LWAIRASNTVRVVARALAHGLDLPGFDDSWRTPLPDWPRPPLGQVVLAEISWAQQHALPWLWRHIRGRSAGDGLPPKRPEPAPVPGFDEGACG
jgi:hypothetical protein